MRGYTLRQLRLLTAAAERQDRRQHLRDVLAARVAQYDAPNFKKYLATLTD